LQAFSSGPDREPVLASGDTLDILSRARNGCRRDLQARIFFAGGPDGLGPRLDLVASRTSWTDHIEKDSTRVLGIKIDTVGTVIDTVADTTYTTRDHTRGVTQAGAVAAYRLAGASLEGTA